MLSDFDEQRYDVIQNDPDNRKDIVGKIRAIKRAFQIYENIRVGNSRVARVTLPNLEDQLTHLFRVLTNEPVDSYPFRWFLANRRELLEMLSFLTSERVRLEQARPGA